MLQVLARLPRQPAISSGHKGLFGQAIKQLESVTWIRTQDKGMVDTLALISGQSLFFCLCLQTSRILLQSWGEWRVLSTVDTTVFYCASWKEIEGKVGTISAQGTQSLNQHWPGEAPQSPGGPFSEPGCRSLEGELKEKDVLDKEEGLWSHLDLDPS